MQAPTAAGTGRILVPLGMLRLLVGALGLYATNGHVSPAAKAAAGDQAV